MPYRKFLCLLSGTLAKVKVTQSCLTLCDPMDCIVHGILLAKILDWVSFLFCRASSQPRDWTQVSCIPSGFFTSWATQEAHGMLTSENLSKNEVFQSCLKTTIVQWILLRNIKPLPLPQQWLYHMAESLCKLTFRKQKCYNSFHQKVNNLWHSKIITKMCQFSQ